MKIFIWGLNTISEMVKDYILEENPNSKIKYVVDEQYVPKNREYCGCEVISWEELKNNNAPDECEILLCIGYNKLNKIRKLIFEKITADGYNVGNYIHPSATISKNSQIGSGNIILENCVIQPYVVLGNANVLWSNVNICHHTQILNYNFLAASTSILGRTKIENCCFFGCSSIVRNRIEIANETIVGAGAFVSKSTLEKQVVMPAKSVIIEKDSSQIELME